MITRRRTAAAALMTALTVATGLMTTAAAPVPASPGDAGGNCVHRQTVDAKTSEAFDYTYHYEHPGGAVLMGQYRNGKAVNPGAPINDRQRQLADGFIFETDRSNDGFWKIRGIPTKPGTYRFDVYTGHQDFSCKELQLTVNVTGKPVDDDDDDHEQGEVFALLPAIPATATVDPSWTIPDRGNLSPAIRTTREDALFAKHLNVCLNNIYQFSLHSGTIDRGGYWAIDQTNKYVYAVNRISAKAGDVVGLSHPAVAYDPHTCGQPIDSFVVTSSMLDPHPTPDDDDRPEGGDAPVVDNSSRLNPWGELPPGLEF